MFCKKCGTKNEADMIFCQNCGESLDAASSTGVATPIANTIKGWANVICGLLILTGIVEIIAGIVATAILESAIFVIIGLVAGALTIAVGYISRALCMVTVLSLPIMKNKRIEEFI